MSYSVLQLKADLTGIIHGTTLNQITGLDNLIYRAARQVLMDVDPMETVRIQTMTNPIYNQVYDYALPSDLKGNRIIDIWPQADRNTADSFLQTYNKDFDVSKILQAGNQFTVIYNTAQRSIRIADINLPQGILIDQCDAVGNWVAGGTASGLQVNNVNFVSGSGALQFNLAAGANPSTGYIEETLPSTLDMSNQYNQSALFFWVDLPSPGDIISTTIRWGTDSSNYYERTLTSTSTGTAFQTGWNLLQGDWLGSTVVGSPDPSNINYTYCGINYNGTAQTAIGVDNIISNMGTLMQIEYYSDCIFRNSITGTFQQSVTSDSDLINLATETYNLLLWKVALYAAQQQQGANSAFDTTYFMKAYEEALARYKTLYKSQVQAPTNSYYVMRKGGYGGYLGNTNIP